MVGRHTVSDEEGGGVVQLIVVEYEIVCTCVSPFQATHVHSKPLKKEYEMDSSPLNVDD